MIYSSGDLSLESREEIYIEVYIYITSFKNKLVEEEKKKNPPL